MSSYLGGQTRKLAVYGRRGNTRIVNTNLRTTLPDTDSDASDTDSDSNRNRNSNSDHEPQVKPTPTKARPALGEKNMNVASPVKAPSKDKPKSKLKPKPKATTTKPTQAPAPAPPQVPITITVDIPSPTKAQRRALHNRAAKRIMRRIIESDDENAHQSDSDSDYVPDELELAERLGRVRLSHPSSSMRTVSVSSDDWDSGVLAEILDAVQQKAVYEFSHVLRQLQGPKARRIDKIGEASYSEVFKVGGKVVKVIPIRAAPGEEDADQPFVSVAADVSREVRITRALADTRGFVQLSSAYLVSGQDQDGYPSELLHAWDRWDERRRERCGSGAENIRPSVLPPTQLYAVLVMADGGADLESFRARNWQQTASIFWQTVQALATAEETHEFEHRDLHWGNVLVSDAGAVTVIDFTLSRIRIGNTVLANPFQDEDTFNGPTSERQFDIYREMRDVTKGAWETFHPISNVMWLEYLADKLLHDMGLDEPQQQDDEEKRAHAQLVEARTWLAQGLPGPRRGRKPKVAPPTSAGTLLSRARQAQARAS